MYVCYIYIYKHTHTYINSCPRVQSVCMASHAWLNFYSLHSCRREQIKTNAHLARLELEVWWFMTFESCASSLSYDMCCHTV